MPGARLRPPVAIRSRVYSISLPPCRTTRWDLGSIPTTVPSTSSTACAAYQSDGSTSHPSSVSSPRRSEEHRLNSSHQIISYAVFCLKKKKHPYLRIVVTRTSHPTDTLDRHHLITISSP